MIKGLERSEAFRTPSGIFLWKRINRGSLPQNMGQSTNTHLVIRKGNHYETLDGTYQIFQVRSTLKTVGQKGPTINIYGRFITKDEVKKDLLTDAVAKPTVKENICRACVGCLQEMVSKGDLPTVAIKELEGVVPSEAFGLKNKRLANLEKARQIKIIKNGTPTAPAKGTRSFIRDASFCRKLSRGMKASWARRRKSKAMKLSWAKRKGLLIEAELPGKPKKAGAIVHKMTKTMEATLTSQMGNKLLAKTLEALGDVFKRTSRELLNA